MKKIISQLFLASLLTVINISFCAAQNRDVMSAYQRNMQPLLVKIPSAPTDHARYNANEMFVQMFEEALHVDESIEWTWDFGTTVSVLTSNDRQFRIITWPVVRDNGEYECFGFVQSYNSKTEEYDVYVLHDKSDEMISVNEQVLDPDNWSGSVYQELIEAYISPQLQTVRQTIGDTNGDLTQVNGDSLWNVLNMLNAKYFLMANAQEPDKSFQVQNPYAMGNAWFVDEVDYVDNANQELDGLKDADLRRVAVVDKQFQAVLGEAAVQDSTAIVELTSYEPNELKYNVKSNQGGVLVFSEVFYPGWEATVDGQPVELGRADYVLRALRIEPGQHEVVMSFFPKTLDTTETLAYVALGILALLIIVLIVLAFKRK